MSGQHSKVWIQKLNVFLWFVLQEILQIHFNKKFWGSEHQRISSSVFVKCDDGAEEMLQPSILVLFCGPGKYVSLIFLTCLTLLFQTRFVHPFWKFKGMVLFFPWYTSDYTPLLICRLWNELKTPDWTAAPQATSAFPFAKSLTTASTINRSYP